MNDENYKRIMAGPSWALVAEVRRRLLLRWADIKEGAPKARLESIGLDLSSTEGPVAVVLYSTSGLEPARAERVALSELLKGVA